MKKLFLVLSSLSFMTVGTVIPNIIYPINNATIQAVPKEVSITNKKIDVREGNAIDLRTDPINLTALGIKDNNALNEYYAVELPGFKASFLYGEKTVDFGKKWGAKMSEGEGDYAEIERFYVENPFGSVFTAIISRKHSLWHDSNGNYNLALVYQLSLYIYPFPGVGPTYAQISAEVGSLVKFY